MYGKTGAYSAGSSRRLVKLIDLVLQSRPRRDKRVFTTLLFAKNWRGNRCRQLSLSISATSPQVVALGASTCPARNELADTILAYSQTRVDGASLPTHSSSS